MVLIYTCTVKRKMLGWEVKEFITICTLLNRTRKKGEGVWTPT